MLTRSNLREVNGERAVPMTGTDFRSTFSVHDATHNKLFSETTYATAYGRHASVNQRQDAQRIEMRN